MKYESLGFFYDMGLSETNHMRKLMGLSLLTEQDSISSKIAFVTKELFNYFYAFPIPGVATALMVSKLAPLINENPEILFNIVDEAKENGIEILELIEDTDWGNEMLFCPTAECTTRKEFVEKLKDILIN
tara:strand:+ start:102 stop:491 length:390 start_codon:yes stop_codon:yes gene_type:complete